MTSRTGAAPAAISLRQLDDALDGVAGVSDEDRTAVWLYAWISRENAARVAQLAA